ncbi:MAG: response regulator [Pseudomonadales bacterium]|nr:response regulator [Pseudomonadales bacterium]
MSAIVPYYHPTTVGFVDDNVRFLESLAPHTPDTLTTKNFFRPENALTWLNQLNPRPPLAHNCFYHDDGFVRFDLAALEQEIKLADRFQRVSVLVVDHAMPTMDGVEFCAQVEDPDIRKLLLTGVADEKVAVAAFNQGLIHRYVPKATIQNVAEIFAHIDILQTRYFSQFGDRITASLATDARQFLWISDVQDTFNKLVYRYEAVEYYLLSQPRGYLLVDRHGKTTRIIVLSDDELRSEIARCRDQGAPIRIQQALARGNRIPYLMEEPSAYLASEPYPWDEVLYPAEKIGAWWLAVVPNPPADIDFDQTSSSYAAFVEQNR